MASREILDPDGDVVLQITITRPDLDQIRHAAEGMPEEDIQVLATWVESVVRSETEDPKQLARFEKYDAAAFAMFAMRSEIDIGDAPAWKYIVNHLRIVNARAMPTRPSRYALPPPPPPPPFAPPPPPPVMPGPAHTNRRIAKLRRNIVDNLEALLTGHDDGDVVELLVSSKVLSLVSPVFKAMFCGSFKEAVDLSEGSSSKSGKHTTISLSADDGVAFRELCYKLHFKDIVPPLYQVDKTFTSLGLENLAIICDKYQCSEASVVLDYVRRQFMEIMQDYAFACRDGKRASKDTIKALFRFLVAAYMFKDEDAFSAAAYFIVFLHPGNIDEDSVLWNLSDHAHLPPNFIGKSPTVLLSNENCEYMTLLAVSPHLPILGFQ
jgi:hypothetical protein